MLIDNFELNDEQKKVVLTSEDVFLNACPGSGKTRALTFKIIHELSLLRSRKKYIVAITYTNRAANEIRERIEISGIDTAQLWIGTIHSFCLEWIVRPYSIYSPFLGRGYRLIDSHESEKILTELCNKYNSNSVSYWDCGYIATSKGYKLSCADARKHNAARQVLKEYFKILKNSQKLDFEMVLHYACRLVSLKHSICLLLSHLFKYILVDEYQDTKEIQYFILSKILHAGCGRTKAFVVGDPNQAIYASLGGYAISVASFSKMCHANFTPFRLNKNYRSSTKIIDYFGEYSVQRSSITSFSTLRDYESKISFNNSVQKDAVIDEIIRLIKLNVDEYGIPPHEICILAPRWLQLATMTRLLISRLPEFDIYGPGMVPFARDIENFFYKLSRIALTTASPKMYVKRVRWAEEAIADLLEVGVNVQRLTSKRLLKISNSIEIDVSDGLAYLKSFFTTFFSELGIDAMSFPLLSEHHHTFFESSQSRINKLNSQGTDFRNISSFRKVFKHRTGITISTIHGVKGAEFDTVIAYGLLDGMVPHFSDPYQEDSAKKLLYVISSRAKKNLHLISETGRKYNEMATPILDSYAFKYDLV